MMKEMFTSRTFSILQLQMFAYHVCNTINRIPFALHKVGLDNLDPAIICPNRLLLGHANRRALAAPVRARNLNEHVQLFDNVEKVFNQTWNQECINQFINGGQGKKEKCTPVSVGDIVVFASA